MTSHRLYLLAQDNGAPPQQPGGLGGLGGMLFPLLAMGLIFYFLVIRPQSAEKKRRAQMLTKIKKNDRVVTIGGIVGTVALVRDDEITLKVDESNNTKITFTRSSVQRVTAAGSAENSDDAGKK